jgi:glycosyltransferase involved in cell wall biosynthesis
VDDVEFDRPKLEGAQFHLGFIGVAPARKRMDLAIDVLAHLRRRDPRYVLFAKTKMPWQYDWIWQDITERAHVDEVLRRIQTDPDLRGAVTFDGFGPDVAGWLRRIGWVLSTSDDESFHLAPAEGMASRAVPLIRNWPGADSIYDPRWIHISTEAMADFIGQANELGRWTELGQLAREQVRSTFALSRVAQAWTAILTSNLPSYVPEPVLIPSPGTSG